MDQIHEMAAKDSRILMTDFVQGQVLEELCSNAYLFVLPSDVEGMAVSLLEAMSYGNCCLVSDIKENTEVVEEHAVTFRKGDVSDLCEKLKELLSDAEQVAKMKSESADFICGKYNWDSVVEETLSFTAETEKGKSKQWKSEQMRSMKRCAWMKYYIICFFAFYLRQRASG